MVYSPRNFGIQSYILIYEIHALLRIEVLTISEGNGTFDKRLLLFS